IEVELKSVVASVFFSSDVANPDTYTKFYSDLQMYSVGPGAPDPQTFMSNFTSAEICSKENKWAARNTTRWRNDEYDRLWKAAETKTDPVKRAALFIRMNAVLTQNVVVIPAAWSNTTAGMSIASRATISPAGTRTCGGSHTGTGCPDAGARP